MKKFTKYTLYLIICIVVLKFIFSIKLEKEYLRPGSIILNTEIKNEIRKNTSDKDIDDIIDYCVDLTASKLRFSTVSHKINLNKSVSKTHCVGYAKTCATICNYAFYVNNIKAKATPAVGQVYFKYLGLNICDILGEISSLLGSVSMKNFTKDHDFVEISTRDKYIYVDACAYDYLFDDLKSTKSKNL